jgi:hypothetical protein
LLFSESTNILALLYTCNRLFNDTFGFYSNIPDEAEYTPLIRGGVVKDWIVLFNDLSSMVNNVQGTNPVGLGVARAYYTSEKTRLSGMRIIVSKEVIQDLNLKKYSNNGFNCYAQEYVYNNVPLYLFFDKIDKNEDNCPVELFELIWTEQVMSDCTFEYIDQLNKIRSHFNEESIRHYIKTAEIIFKGLMLTDCNKRTKEPFDKAKNIIQSIIK